MADINQVITLGIGTPAGVKEFLTFGLQIGAAVTITQNLLFLDKENKEISLSEQNMTIILGKGKWVG